MDSVRENRKENIRAALSFIQSPLAFPDPDGYQDFLTSLVCNLLDEGNAFFREKEWEQAVGEYTEGLKVSCYAEGEEIQIPKALLESLYVNRAAAYHSMGKYDEGVEDCNNALVVCKESRRALYRKALCLKELSRYMEAYDCTSVCLLSNPQDKQVNELERDLAVQLKMKIRKPYVSSKVALFPLGNGPSVVAPDSSHSVPSTPPSSSQPAASVVPDRVEDSELMGDDLDILLDSLSSEQGLTGAEFSDQTDNRMPTSSHTVPPILPAPTPQLPPAFFSSPISQLNCLDSFLTADSGPAATTLNVLDDLFTSGAETASDAPNFVSASMTLDALDSLDSFDDFLDVTPSAVAAKEPETEQDLGVKPLDLLDEVDSIRAVSDTNDHGGDVKVKMKATKRLDCLDSLDSFSTMEDNRAAAVSIRGAGPDLRSDFSSSGFADSYSAAAAAVTQSPKNQYKVGNNHGSVVFNPLSSTHEFLQACSLCYPREGPGIYSYVHKPDLVHNCKQDILLCRRKAGSPSEWTRVRPIPTNTSFWGPFVLCRELINSGDLGVCKYGEKCTFAYNQLEIDVWTAERKGKLNRNLLFETTASKLDPVISVIRLLEEHKGMFIFLCQECYDSKPRIISKRFSENPAICSNLDVCHNFDTNKCLAFVVRTHNINYSKVRPLSGSCHLDLCHQAIRYGCQRENSCVFAHSIIELKTWKVQRLTGISSEKIVEASLKHYNKLEQNSKKEKGNRPSSGGGGGKPKGGGGKSLDMKMKFVCAQCWRGGLISEPDKALKYCNAKARHTWTKDRRVLLVKSPERSKWVQVRPLPHAKNPPLYYDMCAQILEKRKCNYTGNCTFAHSQEEREMWMYMKNNDLRDMQQVYDMWLALTAQSRPADGATFSQPSSEEKFIAMPTDCAESGLHCRLCGKNSNSERQWQQHISSEKHKDRVFSCEGEDEALTWSYRFPGTRFEICPKAEAKCPDGASCDYAHSRDELREWIERRNFLRQKLAKAREDMLIMPDELDFGKFNFLLQD
nr:zinc finger CCCH domain-containing protein 7B isoform X1 [Nothobranchius furzeri]XP_054606701.1 zinc finger CCCH domain-containing protein 7B isoform X1 [Nothobranchius furzeri]